MSVTNDTNDNTDTDTNEEVISTTLGPTTTTTPEPEFALMYDETVVNDCTPLCLIGSINPYFMSGQLFSLGQSYRSTYGADAVDYSETFTNNENILQSTIYTLTPYELEDCYIGVFLNTNFTSTIEFGDDIQYQLTVSIDEVDSESTNTGVSVESNTYRFRCKINDENSSEDYKFFILKQTDDGELYLMLSSEEYYVLDNTNTSTTINPNNNLYLHLYQVYTNAIYVKVFDDTQVYGYLKEDLTIIPEEDIFDFDTYSGYTDKLFNLNYAFMTPYQLPDYALGSFIDSDIKINSESIPIQIDEYYINASTLQYQYIFTFKLTSTGDKEYVFAQSNDPSNTELQYTDKCSDSSVGSTYEDKLIFTFWQTLDKQFTVCKIFTNSINNCISSNTNGFSSSDDSSLISYSLIGRNTNKALFLASNFIGNGDDILSDLGGANFSFSESSITVEDLYMLVMVLELSSQSTLLEQLDEEQMYTESGPAIELPTPTTTSPAVCNNPKFNLMVLLKIISVFIAIFMFIDLDKTRELPIKIFRFIFAMFFSEIYVVFQILRYVIWGR